MENNFKFNFMKTLTSWKFLAVFLLTACFSQVLSAKDVYLSSTGDDDENDGLSASAPVATVSKALNLVYNISNSTIHVSGFISTVPDNNGGYGAVIQGNFYVNLTIEGDDKTTCGFDGGGVNGTLNFQAVNRSITIKNLTFKNGNTTQGGGLRIINSNSNDSAKPFTVENCIFKDNYTSASGTMHVYNATAVIRNCEFRNNKAKLGGGIYQASAGGLVIVDNCIIENNDNTTIANSDGGAIYLANPNGFTINNCIIRNNKILRYGGGIYINPSNSTNVNANNTVVIKNTLIAKNESTGNSGGGVYVGNATTGSSIDVSLINTTIFGNKTSQHGGGLIATGAQPGSSLRFINCTVTDNESTNNNGGFGAGVSVRSADQNIATYIYNSIFEGNYASAGGTTTVYSDFWFSGGTITPQGLLGTNAFINNSIVGTNIGNFSGTPTTDNKINLGASWSGLATPHADYITNYNYIPLLSTANARHKGDAQYLLAKKLLTDQTGTTRKNIARGIVDAGAVEYALPEYVIADEAGTSTDYKAGTYGDIIFTDGDDFTVAGGDEAGSNYYGVKYKKTVEAGKWYALGFPFEVVGFYCEDFEYGKPGDDGEGPVLDIYNGNDVGDFFVKTFTDGEGDAYQFNFHTGSTLEAGKGYIVRFPSAFDGREITFVSALNPALTNDAQIEDTDTEVYKLHAHHSVVAASPTSLVENFHYYRLNGSNEFARTTDPVSPFEAFIAVAGINDVSALRSISLDGNDGTTTEIKPVENENPVAIRYYNLQGVEVNSPVKGNVYVVKKVYESGVTQVEKQIK
ncbi:hypothetical protein FACS1894176_02080 [Bacteroidia bacterium]|nr:hypothetical protein FACS1894176_02080 [Bacteroidia bacterium]